MILFLVGVSFVVLVEWYFLRRGQLWVGCRVTRYFRLMQTLVDGRKLFTKSKSRTFFFFSLVFFTSSLFCIAFRHEFLYLLFFLSILRVCLLLITFVSSNSFAYISMLWVVLLGISFDVLLCFFSLVLIFSVLNSFYFSSILLSSFILMELGWAPFDLLERESEIVSRYNIEYSRIRFTFLFLREYGGFFWALGFCSFFFSWRFFQVFLYLIFLIGIWAVLPRMKFNQILFFSWRIRNLFIFIFFFNCEVIHKFYLNNLIFLFWLVVLLVVCF